MKCNTKREKIMLRIVRGIKRQMQDMSFDKAVRPRDDASRKGTRTKRKE
ncbi:MULTISPECIES: hypothetical protein [Okeania]|nr:MULTISPECIES: hypothetical protein [Okeania]